MKTRLTYILLLLCAAAPIIAQQNPLIITPTTNGYSIEFNLPEYSVRDTALVELFSTTEVFNYIQIDEKFGITDNIGYPQLPQLTFDLPVAYRASNFQVSVSNVVTQEIALYKRILPVQNDLNELEDINPISLNAAYYASDGSIFNYNHQLSESYVVFGTKGIGMSVFPFIYNPQTGKLTVLKQATFQLNYQLNGQAAPPASAYDSEVKQMYLSDFFEVINSNSGVNSMMSPYTTTTLPKGRYLMITAPSLLSTLTPFTNYKRNLGFEVNVATSDVIGNSAESIKSYIKEQYDNLETRPDFVLLAGSHTLIPAAMGNSSGTDMGNPITDLPYACMDGDNDYYADLIIGRFPVSSTVELERVLKKTTFMEMNMHRFEKKAKLWAGYEPSWIKRGITHATFANAHKHASKTLTTQGYSCETLHQPNLSQVQSALIANPMFFIYFGHGGFYTIDGNYYDDITSGAHSVFPFVFSISCRTGNFGLGTNNIGVKWLVNDANKGGVTFFGATTSTYQNANKNIEKKIFDKVFKENDQIGKITTIGMKNFMNRFWASLNPWRTKLHMKRYNLLGDPSLKIKGEKILTVPFIINHSTATLLNPTNIPVTWSVTGNFLLSDPTNTSVIITRTGIGSGTVTAQFAGLGAATEDILTNDFSISGPSTICDQAIYTIDNLPEGATVQWSLAHTGSVPYPDVIQNIPLINQCTITNEHRYPLTTTLTAQIYYNGNIIHTLTKTVTSTDNSTTQYGSYYQQGCVVNNVTLRTLSGSINGNYFYLNQGCLAEITLYDMTNKSVSFNSGYPPSYWSYDATNSKLLVRPAVGSSGVPTTFKITGGCTDKTVQFFTYSLNEGRLSPAFELSPNPATSTVTVEMEEETPLNNSAVRMSTDTKTGSINYTIQLWNSSGLLKQVETDQTSYQLDLTGVPPGFYYVHVIKDGQTHRRQLVVQ